MVSSFMSLRRSSSSNSKQLQQQNTGNDSSLYADSINRRSSSSSESKKEGNGLLSLLSSNHDNNDNRRRSNSASTTNSSISEDSVIIRRSNSLNSSDKHDNSNTSPEEDYEETGNYRSGSHSTNDDNMIDDEDPFENEVLLQDFPLSPPKELHPGRLYALYEFSGPDPSQCDLEYDDAVILLNDDDSYWWLIKKVKDGKIGFAPAECLETPGERLARLNCWKNEELERIGKEENKKKSKSLLSLTRKASKLTNNSDLGSLRKKGGSSKSVIFNETVEYSEPAFISDDELSDDYDEEDEDEEDYYDQEGYEDENVNKRPDDNDTLDGNEENIKSIQQQQIVIDMDEEEEDNIDSDEEVDREENSPAPLVVSKIRKKSIENLKNAALFKTDSLNTNNKTTIKRSPTPTTSKHQQHLANRNNSYLNVNGSDKYSSSPNSNIPSISSATPSPQSLTNDDGSKQRNSMLSVSDDDMSLYNRSSSIYDAESMSFRKSQDMETMLMEATTPKNNLATGNSNGNLNSMIQTTPPSNNNTLIAPNPTSSFAKRTDSMATVSSTYSIGDYSPSSSEFESDTNISNNQTPTKFQVLNSLQLSNSTINNGGLKGKISNSSSINFGSINSRNPSYNHQPSNNSSETDNNLLNVKRKSNSSGDYSDITDHVDFGDDDDDDDAYTTEDENEDNRGRPRQVRRHNKSPVDNEDAKKTLGSPVNIYHDDSIDEHTLPESPLKTEEPSINDVSMSASSGRDLASDTISEIDKQINELNGFGTDEEDDEEDKEFEMTNKTHKLLLSPSKSLTQSKNQDIPPRTRGLELNEFSNIIHDKTFDDLSDEGSETEEEPMRELLKTVDHQDTIHTHTLASNSNATTITTNSTFHASPENLDMDGSYEEEQTTPNSSVFIGSNTSLDRKTRSIYNNSSDAINNKPKFLQGTIFGSQTSFTKSKFEDIEEDDVVSNTTIVTAKEHIDDANGVETVTSKSLDKLHDNNKTFVSLLENYHPDIHALFAPVFSKVDSLEAKILEAKKFIC